MEFSKVSGKKNTHKVLLYALSTCMWCKMTKEFLKDNDVEFEYVDVDLCEEVDRQKIRDHIRSKGGNIGFPTIIIDDIVLFTGFQKDKIKEALEI